MKILYHDALRQEEEEKKGATYFETLEDLLPNCQFLSLNAPNLPSTKGMLNAARIALLPDGAIVVNAARGTLIDDDALIAGLMAGKPAAAGLDVYNNEPTIDPRYKDLPNTFLMPHIGSATAETRDAMGFRALDNLDAFFAGKEPGDRVA
jgi:lactate dehydrogenase-like 2-hydroxyacid dehydrogenase